MSAHLALVLLVPLLAAHEARAQERDREGPRLAVSAGLFDVDRRNDLELGVDYAFRALRYRLVPHVGLGITERASVFVYGGVRWDLAVSRRWRVAPSFAVSLYEQGQGKDLGHVVEFRSGIELDFQLASGARWGLGAYHLSNGSLSEHNPGANSLLLRYLLPPRRHP